MEGPHHAQEAPEATLLHSVLLYWTERAMGPDLVLPGPSSEAGFRLTHSSAQNNQTGGPADPLSYLPSSRAAHSWNKGRKQIKGVKRLRPRLYHQIRGILKSLHLVLKFKIGITKLQNLISFLNSQFSKISNTMKI